MFCVLRARIAPKADYKMARTIKFSIVLLLVLCSVGCQNRCGSCGVQNGPFGGGLFQPVATTVPAPSTYSLQQGARTARQQDYYTIPNTGQQPAVRQPTPLNNSNSNPNPNLSPQGWRQVPQNSNTQQFNNQQLNATSLLVQNPAGSPAYQAAQVNPNYQTTAIDERRDPTRLAVTDASAVRAPARFFPTGNVNRLPHTPVATTHGTVPSSGYSQFASNTQPQFGATQINGSVVYQNSAPNYGNNSYGNNPYGNNQPGINQNFSQQQARVFNPPVTSTTPELLAQSTTERTASNVQAGWRNSQIPNVNR